MLTSLSPAGHYDGVPFHRIVPGFIAQTGGGDDCIYDEGSFGVEANQVRSPCLPSRSALALTAVSLHSASSSTAEDSSPWRPTQPPSPTRRSASPLPPLRLTRSLTSPAPLLRFFFTLDATPELQNQHTLFGRVTGDSLFNLLKLSDVELEPGSDRPVYAPVIKSAEVRVDPFDESDDPIRPRITAAERKEQERAKREMKAERAKERQQGKRKGTKCVLLLLSSADKATH